MDRYCANPVDAPVHHWICADIFTSNSYRSRLVDLAITAPPRRGAYRRVGALGFLHGIRSVGWDGAGFRPESKADAVVTGDDGH